MPDLRFEPLLSTHDREKFSCGEDALNTYIRKQAGQDVRRQVARVFVASYDRKTMVGFYTLSAFSVEAKSLPDKIRRRLPRYPVPSALIGRLAVDAVYQHKGFGKLLLVDALKRVQRASESIALHAVIVDAKNERAVSFYQNFGFQSFPEQTQRLFLPVASIPKS